ncbi:MAG: hypothetical protein ACUVTA_07560 [Thermodesulfitimonas sp.]
MMRAKTYLKVLLSALIIGSLCVTAAFAVQQGPLLSNDPSVEKVTPDMLDKAGKVGTYNGVTIWRDAIGGTVFSNLPGEVSVPKEESDRQREFLTQHPEAELEAAKQDMAIRRQQPDKFTVTPTGNYYDIEYNPI